MNKRIMAALAAFVFMLTATCALAGADKPELLYFFENYCGTCAPEQAFAAEYAAATGGDIDAYRCTFYNLRYAAAREALQAFAAENGIDQPTLHLPILVLDGEIHLGWNREGLETTPPAAPSPHNAADIPGLVYLYLPACDGCRTAGQVIAALPDSISIYHLNMAENPALATALFAQYEVPEASQLAPMVFLADEWLGGASAIAALLPDMASDPASLGVHLPSMDATDAPARAWSLPATFAAGLVGGLNPCALSMLLFFLTMLLSLRGRAGLRALAFLAAKFITYFLLGTLLFGLFSRFNAGWLPLVLKIVVTCLSAVFIVLNLRDAWAARHEAYGDIRNQLPAPLRRFAHTRIKATLSGGAQVVSIAVLGVVVAASEFLCAGQVYLSTLLSAVQAQLASARMLLLLLAYCAGFILPSAALSLLAVSGKNLMDMSEWLRRRMPAIKVITALFFAILLVWLWVF